MTLIMVAPDGRSAEFELLCCDRVSRTYLADLYALYAGKDAAPSGDSDRVRSVTSLEVDEIVAPERWLNCVLWSRFRRGKDGRAALEVFVKRPAGRSRSYYAVGTKGDVLMSAQGSVRVHETTVRLLCGEARLGCPDPKIWVLEGERSLSGT